MPAMTCRDCTRSVHRFVKPSYPSFLPGVYSVAQALGHPARRPARISSKDGRNWRKPGKSLESGGVVQPFSVFHPKGQVQDGPWDAHPSLLVGGTPRRASRARSNDTRTRLAGALRSAWPPQPHGGGVLRRKARWLPRPGLWARKRCGDNRSRRSCGHAGTNL